MDFEIIWQLPEKEWEKANRMRHKHAPGSDYDRTLTPLYDLLYGPVQMVYGPDKLFPKWQNSTTIGLRMPLLDVAVGLHQILQMETSENEAGEAHAYYILHETRLTFSATRKDDLIEFTVSESQSQPLLLPSAAFARGIREFLQSFIGQVKNKVPKILEWESVTPLRSDQF